MLQPAHAADPIDYRRTREQNVIGGSAMNPRPASGLTTLEDSLNRNYLIKMLELSWRIARRSVRRVVTARNAAVIRADGRL